MIKHLSHTDIDKAKWDLCVVQSTNSLIYAYSWYLDIVSPNWEALVLGDYEAIFPLTHRKKIVPYLFQPFFTQQLGLFYKNGIHKGMIDEFIANIPSKFKYVEINLNEDNKPNDNNHQLKKRKNFILDLRFSYDNISKGFSDPTKRNIKKSKKKQLSIQSITANTAVDFYIQQKGSVTYGVEASDYLKFKELLVAVDAHQMMFCRGVFSDTNELLATAIIYSTQSRLCLINNCTSKQGKEMYAMYFLIDELIKQFENQPILLDFEGSEIAGIAQFNKGFGATKRVYPQLKINRLPWYLRLLKN